MLQFKVDNIGKSNLDKRDYMFQAKRKEEPVMPSIMESKLYGNNRMSYQDLGEARLVIKHSQPVNLDLPAGRTMHIDSIYIENAQGERFRYPFKHLSGARALAEHIKHGGIPYDSIGKHITGLSEELAGLRKFKGYVMRQEQVSEAMGSVTTRVVERIEEIKKQIQQLQRSSYYEAFAESFEEQDEVLIPEEIQNDLINRLTIRTFNEELKSVFPYIYKFVNEGELPVTELSADDILGETSSDYCDACDRPDDECVCDKEKTDEGFDPELEFESFLEGIVNEDRDELFSPNKAAKLRAIEKLNQVLAKELPGGPNGINAVESLKGIIDDPEFISSLIELDPNLDVRPVIQQWLNDNLDKFPGNAAETLALIDFGGEESEPAAEEPVQEPAAEEPPVPAAPPEVPPAPEAAPAAPAPAAPVAESIINALRKAKRAGATLETALDFGFGVKTIAEIIEECGCDPRAVGFSDEEGEEPQESGVPAMLKFISGFYNKDANNLQEGNFTIGGTRMKIKLKKAWEEGEFGDCPASDVAKVFKLIDAKDPSNDTSGQEQHHILKLAGVRQQPGSINDTVDGLENNIKGIKFSFAESNDPLDEIKALTQRLNRK